MEEITYIKSPEKIFDVLELFSDSLQSLQSGVNYRRRMAEKFAEYGIFFFISEEKIEGFAAFYANDKKERIAYLSMIAVLPEFRDRHIGKRVLEECIRTSIEAGMSEMRLEVNKKNQTAIVFYEKNGFSIIENQIGEKSFYMQKVLR